MVIKFGVETMSLVFAIMNSASFNLREDKDAKFKDQEGVIMKKALQSCKTLEDFEKITFCFAKNLWA